MKKASILIVLVLLSSLVLAACGGGGAKGTVQDYLKGGEKKDADKINKTLCKDSDESKADKSSFEGLKSIEFNSMKYEEKDKKDDSVSIVAKGKVKAEYENDGKTTKVETDIELTFKLKKEDGDWCIMSVEGSLFGG